MARGNRLRGIEGGLYHVTHRCHNRVFLLRFAQDRNEYRRRLREHVQEFDVSLLDYCVTCNHVHLLIDTPDRQELSGLMRMVEGESARVYNRRKNRSNAFWGDNYHATFVEFVAQIGPADVSRCEVELAESSDKVWFLREEAPCQKVARLRIWSCSPNR